MQTSSLLIAGCAALMLAGAVTDLWVRRIPNVLTVSGFAVALALRALAGVDPLLAGLGGAALAFGFGLAFLALGAIGGGDAKLLIAVGAFLGTGALLPALMGTAIAGGLLAILYAWRRRIVVPMLLDTLDLAKATATLGLRGGRTTLDAPNAVSVPYGVAIAAGTLTSLFLRGGL